jgi:hypothetical protein
MTVVTTVGLVTPSSAAFHVTVIDQVMTSYQNNPDVQFIDMRMLIPLQNSIKNSVLVAFDATGSVVGDILVVPNNVAKQGTDTRWLVGTSAFQTAAGITPDFIIPTGMLRTGGGMLCYGGGTGGGFFPQMPPNWDRTNFTNYVDCVAYGNYSGPANTLIGTATPLNADGHSLQRNGNTRNNSKDFICIDSTNTENNTGSMSTLAASVPCEMAATPTPPAPAATATPPTPSGTLAPAHPCAGDCNGDGVVKVDELIIAVNIVLGNADRSACPAFGSEQTLMISDLISAVNNVLNGCPATPTPLTV